MKRIWIIVTGEPLVSLKDANIDREMRSNRLARELSNRGHDVTLITSSFQHHDKVQYSSHSQVVRSKDDQFDVVLIRSPGYKRNVSFERFWDHVVLSIKTSLFIKKLRRPDLIYISWPPVDLAYSVSNFAKRNKIPYIIDVRDVWPDTIYERVGARDLFTKKLVHALLLPYEYMAKSVFSSVYTIIGITQEFANWGRAKGKNRCEDTFEVLLSSKRNELVKSETGNQKILNKSSPVTIIWAGTLMDQKVTTNFLKAFDKFTQNFPNHLRLIICGSGTLGDFVQNLSEKNPSIDYRGFVSQSVLSELMSIADYGLLSYDPTWDFLNSVPNKTGEYLSAGLKVLTNLDGKVGKIIPEELRVNFSEEGDLTELFTKLASLGPVKPAVKDKAINFWFSTFDDRVIYEKFVSKIESAL
jgi:hypothetical protein